MSSKGIADPVLVAAARHGLGVAEKALDALAVEWDRLLELARFDHLTGFLGDAVLDGIVQIPPDHAESLQKNWRAELLSCVALEAMIIRSSRVLGDADVPIRLTKGAALAHLDYPDPSVRTFGDVDLIIHPDHWQRALEALSVAGYERQEEEPGVGYDERFGKGATLRSRAGFELDLHRRLAIGRFGVSSKMGDLFERSEPFKLGGDSINALIGPHRLLHGCYHASLGGFRRLRAFRDVAQLILVTGVDWSATFEISRAWRAEPVVAAAVLETWHRLQLDPAHPAVERAVSTAFSRADQKALEVFASERPFSEKALTTLGRLSLRERVRFLAMLTAHRLKERRKT